MRLPQILVCSLACVCAPALFVQAALFDHSLYDTVLQHYVNEDGLVDYGSIRENSLTALQSYLERLADVDLAGWPAAERLAFWIDAYNARVIYILAQRPTMKKISEDFEIFNQPFKVAGVTLTLNDIEHRILRGTTNPDNKKGPIPGLTLEKRDPNVHFALVCGAVSCPRLRNFAYTDDNVEDTLLINAKDFANSSKHVDSVNGRLRLSSIFKWDRKDFAAVGGVAAYLSELIDPARRGDAAEIQQLLAAGLTNAEYTYGWTINAQ
jgi:hypothetical protein